MSLSTECIEFCTANCFEWCIRIAIVRSKKKIQWKSETQNEYSRNKYIYVFMVIWKFFIHMSFWSLSLEFLWCLTQNRQPQLAILQQNTQSFMQINKHFILVHSTCAGQSSVEQNSIRKICSMDLKFDTVNCLSRNQTKRPTTDNSHKSQWVAKITEN